MLTFVRRLFRRDVPEVVSLRFGHDSALTAIQAVIHYLVAASLPPEGSMNLFIENPCGEPIALTLKFEPAVKRHACCVLLVLFLSNKKSTISLYHGKIKK